MPYTVLYFKHVSGVRSDRSLLRQRRHVNLGHSGTHCASQCRSTRATCQRCIGSKALFTQAMFQNRAWMEGFDLKSTSLVNPKQRHLAFTMHCLIVSASDLHRDTPDCTVGLSGSWHIGGVPAPKLNSQVCNCLLPSMLCI